MSDIKQIGGDHYGGNEFQHWDMVAQCGTDYFAAVATKYLRRWRDAGGVQDIQKAITYVDKLLSTPCEPSSDPASVDEFMTQYIEINSIPPREARASRLLFGWQTTMDLLEARAIMAEIIQHEVCTWEEMMPLLGKIKPDGWQGYTFEGAKENKYWFRCIVCRVRFPVAVDAPPVLHHECDGSKPSLAYVNQDR
jgi:hypothetical protein